MRTFEGLFDSLGELDWLAVLVATAAAMVFGFIWYGPLFGKAWAKASGIAMGSKPDPGRLLMTAVYFFVFNIGLALAVIVPGTGFGAEVQHAVVVGLVYGILLIAPALYSAVVWAKKSLTVFLIDALHWVAIAAVSTFVQILFV
jgi:hypothetical protein